VIGAAAGEARQLRQNWLGPEHYLLAVLAEPGTASEAMAEFGITHERFAGHLARVGKVNERRVRYVESKGITMNPAAHDVSGWAQGYASAFGRRKPTPEDWLLAVLYGNNGLVASLLNELGASAPAAVDALRRRGVKTPDYDPAEDKPWKGIQAVEVASSEWRSVVDVLAEEHPPGSESRWGFNSRPDRPGKIQFVAEELIDLDAIVEQARARLARPDKVGPRPMDVPTA
jgi:ATP-dependent Clp protease ATP-binding subunit ClpA